MLTYAYLPPFWSREGACNTSLRTRHSTRLVILDFARSNSNGSTVDRTAKAMTDSDSDDSLAYIQDLPALDDGLYEDLLTDESDSGLPIRVFINQARVQERRKRRYTEPVINCQPTPRYIRRPDVVVHPAIGTPIEPFPLDDVLPRYSSEESAFNHLNFVALTCGFALTKGQTRHTSNGYHHQVFNCAYGSSRGRGNNGPDYASERRCRFTVSISNTAPDCWFQVSYVSDPHTHAALDPKGVRRLERLS